MPRREIPPEIWAHILRFVHRPLPDPDADQGALHQQDMASCMRVNKVRSVASRIACTVVIGTLTLARKVLYHLTAPMLYDAPIVADISSFFVHCDTVPAQRSHGDATDTSPPPFLDGRTKANCLRYVKTLHLIYRHIPVDPPEFEMAVMGQLERTAAVSEVEAAEQVANRIRSASAHELSRTSVPSLSADGGIVAGHGEKSVSTSQAPRISYTTSSAFRTGHSRRSCTTSPRSANGINTSQPVHWRSATARHCTGETVSS